MGFTSWYDITFKRKTPRKRQRPYIDGRWDNTELENQFGALKHRSLRYASDPQMQAMARQIDNILKEMSNHRDRIGHKVWRRKLKRKEWRRRPGQKMIDSEGNYVRDKDGDFVYTGKWGDLYVRLKKNLDEYEARHYGSNVYAQLGKAYAESVNLQAGTDPEGPAGGVPWVGARATPEAARAAQATRTARARQSPDQFGPRVHRRRGQ